MANRLPIEEFHAERKKRKSKLISGLTILLLAQVLAAGYYGKQIVEMDFHNRVYREYEIRKTGSIEIPTGIYSGETDFGLFQGEGDFRYKTGTVYSGDWDNDQINGTGKISVPTEGSYTGDFLDGEKSGQGEFKWEDGSDVRPGSLHEL